MNNIEKAKQAAEWRTIPACTVVQGDMLVEFHAETGKLKSVTKVTSVDRLVCRHHVHLNSGCYDAEAPVVIAVM